MRCHTLIQSLGLVLVFCANSQAGEFLKKEAIADDLTNHIRLVRVVEMAPVEGRYAISVDIEFEGWEKRTGRFPQPALSPVQEKGLLLNLSEKYVGQTTGTKFLRFSGNLKDGRMFAVDVLCYAAFPGNALGLDYHLEWPENPTYAGLKHFGSSRLEDQDGENCHWGLWGKF